MKLSSENASKKWESWKTWKFLQLQVDMWEAGDLIVMSPA